MQSCVANEMPIVRLDVVCARSWMDKVEIQQKFLLLQVPAPERMARGGVHSRDVVVFSLRCSRVCQLRERHIRGNRRQGTTFVFVFFCTFGERSQGTTFVFVLCWTFGERNAC